MVQESWERMAAVIERFPGFRQHLQHRRLARLPRPAESRPGREASRKHALAAQSRAVRLSRHHGRDPVRQGQPRKSPRMVARGPSISCRWTAMLRRQHERFRSRLRCRDRLDTGAPSKAGFPPHGQALHSRPRSFRQRSSHPRGFQRPAAKTGAITDDTRIRRLAIHPVTLLNGGASSSSAPTSAVRRADRSRNSPSSPSPTSSPKSSAKPVKLAPDCVGPEVEAAARRAPARRGASARKHPLPHRGRRKANEARLRRRKLAGYRSAIYVNDAFGTAHRAHSSMVGVDLPQKAARVS